MVFVWVLSGKKNVNFCIFGKLVVQQITKMALHNIIISDLLQTIHSALFTFTISEVSHFDKWNSWLHCEV